MRLLQIKSAKKENIFINSVIKRLAVQYMFEY